MRKKLIDKILVTIVALALAAGIVWAAADRSVTESNVSNVVLDLNEELTEIYTHLPVSLDTLAGTNDYTASVEGMGLLTSYADGQKFRGIIPSTNTSTTINLDIDGLGNASVLDKAGAAIPVGGLAQNSAYTFEFFGAPHNHWRVMSPLTVSGAVNDEFCVAVSDETTTLTTGTAKVTFNMPRAMTVTSVFAYVRTAPTGGVINVDINEDADAEGAGGAVDILSTNITIDSGERRSSTAATPPVIADSALAQHSEMTIDIDVVTGTPNGLKVCFVGSFS